MPVYFVSLLSLSAQEHEADALLQLLIKYGHRLREHSRYAHYQA